MTSFVELHAQSAFSFLEGAEQPDMRPHALPFEAHEFLGDIAFLADDRVAEIRIRCLRGRCLGAALGRNARDLAETRRARGFKQRVVFRVFLHRVCPSSV